KINLAGFGIFERKTQQARKARNPQTRKIIEVPSKKKFVFRASSKIKYK
ncbi:MAG: HU family DNA-binding protein, partial [Thermoplasmataceae archaeon]